ncbi:Hypothetical predicted protein [Cloeon dipterum]|uniref:DNL-type domain-containing protein n=1 Tax=Cloeon dipterum TaxID=197152 RepID=A0A8S1DNW0_9INSE|nr:Hypothetical predicted protein [Cloeon dipterum]
MTLKLHHLRAASRFLSLQRRLISSYSKPPILQNSPNLSVRKLRPALFYKFSPPLYNFSLRLCSSESKGVPLGKLEGRFNLIYTCGVCSHRNSHFISKHAYEKGVVIVTCEGCKNRHLIADHLGWFQDFQEKNIEEMMAKKGQVVQRVKAIFEYSE